MSFPQSSSMAFTVGLTSFINALDLTFAATTATSLVYQTDLDDDLSIVVSPLTTVLDRDAKDVIRERVASQITFVKRVGQDVEEIDSLIKKIEELQQALFYGDVVVGSKRWIIEQVELSGSIKTSGGDNFEGIFDGDDLGDAGVFKTNLIVAAARFLKISR